MLMRIRSSAHVPCIANTGVCGTIFQLGATHAGDGCRVRLQVMQKAAEIQDAISEGVSRSCRPPRTLSYVSKPGPMVPCAPIRQALVFIRSRSPVAAPQVPEGSHLAPASSSGLTLTAADQCLYRRESRPCRIPVRRSRVEHGIQSSRSDGLPLTTLIINARLPCGLLGASLDLERIASCLYDGKIGVCAGCVLPHDGVSVHGRLHGVHNIYEWLYAVQTCRLDLVLED